MNDPYASWGRYPPLPQHAIAPSWADELPPKSQRPLLPRGNGRSYGDCCLVPDGGTLVDLRKLDRWLGFDPATGVLHCEAGVLLGDIQEQMLPRGWCLPVSPGTQLVTVGGAIANDVHGKNHHRRGSFGHHLRSFELVRSDGERIACSEQSNASLFRGTIGGLGLTGFITRAEIELVRVGSPMLCVESRRFSGIQEFAALSDEADATFEYTVAWIDCLASIPRGIFIRANHAEEPTLAAAKSGRRSLRMPFTPPISLINQLSLKLFNEAYFRRPLSTRQVVHLMDHLYPLDAIADWNRMYGPRGFQQYQCLAPTVNAAEVIGEILATISRCRAGSFLAVLKRFGAMPSTGLLSFPRAGWTLALDFPMNGARTQALLDELDRIVVAAGGAIYPAKDAHMSASTFQRCYPHWRELEALRDPAIMSAFWQRVTAPASNTEGSA